MTAEPDPLDRHVSELARMGAEVLASLDGADRLARLERIVRDHGLHDTTCARSVGARDQKRTGMYAVLPACNCWLVEPDTTQIMGGSDARGSE